jgi:hypothetical protein
MQVPLPSLHTASLLSECGPMVEPSAFYKGTESDSGPADVLSTAEQQLKRRLARTHSLRAPTPVGFKASQSLPEQPDEPDGNGSSPGDTPSQF